MATVPPVGVKGGTAGTGAAVDAPTLRVTVTASFAVWERKQFEFYAARSFSEAR